MLMDSNNNTNHICMIQHVTKASSKELLSKFSEIGGSESKRRIELRISLRRKRGQMRTESDESPSGRRRSLGEKSLLPPATKRSSSAALIRRVGIGKGKLIKGRCFKNKSILGAIEKTWRRTVEEASKVFMEKHYNHHRRLINDAVL